MNSTNMKSLAKDTRKNSVEKDKNEIKNARKSGSHEIHMKKNRKFSHVEVSKNSIYSQQKRNKKNNTNNRIQIKTSSSLPKANLNSSLNSTNVKVQKKENVNKEPKIEVKKVQKIPKKESLDDKKSELKNVKEETKASISNTNNSINNGKKSSENTLIINEDNGGCDDSKKFLTEKNEILKKVNNILNQDNINTEQLIENIKILLDDYPAINKFDKVKSELLTNDDFEIFDDEKNNKKFLFKVNLNNIISVINLLWEQSNKSSTIFLNFLKKLDIYFSFVQDKGTSGIDFIILTPISHNLYNYISTYGKHIFEDKSLAKGAKLFVNNSEKFQFDVGYYFEDMNVINLINLIGEKNCKILPKIMYYIKKKAALKLIELKIVNTPKDYKFHDLTEDSRQYHGYNEFDLIIYMNESINIKENENFKFINKPKKNDSSLKLIKGHYYFFEFKNEIRDAIKNISGIREDWMRFRESLKNIQITQDIQFDLSNCHLIFFCDKNYDDVKYSINKFKFKENVVYSNPQIGLNILLKYDRKIKYLTQHVDLLTSKVEEDDKKLQEQQKDYNTKLQDYNVKLQEQQKDYNTKLQDYNVKLQEQQKDYNTKLQDYNVKLQEQQKDYNNKFKEQQEEFNKKFQEQQNCIESLKSLIQKNNDKMKIEKELDINKTEYELYKNTLSLINYPIEIKEFIAIKDLEKNFDFTTFDKCYDCFLNISKSFEKLRQKDNLLCFRINKYIGKNIIKKEEKDEWISFKKEFEKKIKANRNIGYYYEGLFLFLYGKMHKTKVDYDILSNNNSTIRTYVKNLINFISIFEENYNTNIDHFEIKFQTTIIYIANKIRGADYISNKLKTVNQSVFKIDINTEGKIKKKLEANAANEIRNLMKEIITGFNGAN